MKKIYLKSILKGMLAVSLLTLTGCGNIIDNAKNTVDEVLNQTDTKDKENATAVAIRFVEDYFNYEGNENSELLDVFKGFRAGFVENRPLFVSDENPFLLQFEDKPMVDEIKVEDAVKSTVSLTQYDEYKAQTTAKQYNGDMRVYAEMSFDNKPFYGFEIEALEAPDRATLKGFGEWKYGDKLPIDISNDEPGWYKAYDVTLRWSYVNRDMMIDVSNEDDCLVNRVIFRVVYVDQQWQIYQFFYSEDNRVCVTVI